MTPPTVTPPALTASSAAETIARRQPDREATATRLIASARKLSFDPLEEVEWERPHDPDLGYAPTHRLPLLGTDLFERLGEEQRRDLGRHQVSSIAAAGIWFEVVLMRLLLRHAYWLDPTERHTQYALIETGDECRHSVMFGRLIEWLGTPTYGPGRKVRWLGNAFVSPMSNHALAYAGALYVEDVLDRLQREVMDDDTIQPVVRQVSRIHVIEESRHMSFAREELPRQLAAMGRVDLARTRLALPTLVELTTRALISPKLYAAMGLDVEEAKAAEAASEPWQETLRWAAQDALGYFADLDLIPRRLRPLWARTPLRR